MSRRAPNPAQERAQKNQQTLKNLLKLEPNKICADCKINKHPRWASWNLGIFVCIRCSGIHRSMGTHISRVKSVDLDAWTDEQLQSMLNWGNARANKYWEAKLAARHTPSDSKVESFIRTKYELKRWVMDGPMPDPSTLDDGDDIPLSLVKEKQTIERKESIRKASIGQASKPGPAAAPVADLIGGDPVPQRASTTSPPTPKVVNKGAPAPPKTTSTKDSLLGLDFFGDQPAAPARPASTTGTQSSGGSSRPDLKQSILSLYATAPRPQVQPVAQQPATQHFGGMPAVASQQPAGSLVDAFGGLSFGNPTTRSSPPPAADPFASLASPSSAAKFTTSTSNAFGGLSGGSFFDSKPAQPAAPSLPKSPSITSPGLAGLSSLTSPANNIPPSKPAQPASSAFGDLFDLSSPAPQPPAAAANPAPVPTSSSVFNLSAAAPKSPAAAAPAAPTSSASAATVGLGSNSWATSDVWGDNAWGNPEPAAPAATSSAHPAAMTTTNDFGWGSSSMGGGSLASPLASQSIVPGAGGFSTTGGFKSTPQVSADEEFGGWSSGPTATTSTTTTSSTTKPAGGFGGSDDLFSNVWQ
ncbi:hypothetical protein jhhlp_003275 [Lomentospora prolificans]|uniref:Arf-GAP domain-containing protein n=1 Tax=Lomentospora prolificans TaxID=41688 RepID=A0A2N3NGD5_9PEZI|nr:hypothetical protein jhhlp_003275 [Lomentospora prolificans]